MPLPPRRSPVISPAAPVLLLLQVVDLLDVLIGDLLDFVEALLLVVFRDLVVLEQLLQPLVGVAPHLAHAVAAFLGQLVDVARQLLAAFLGERRHAESGPPCRRSRVQAEIRGADGLLDRGRSATDRTAGRRSASAPEPTGRRPGSAASSSRRRRRGRCRAWSTEARPVRTPASSWRRCSIAVFIRLLTSVNSPFRSLTSIVGPHAVTTDPTGSPAIARLMFPGVSRLKTTIGRRLSMQSEMAVASITFRPLLEHLEIRDPLEAGRVRDGASGRRRRSRPPWSPSGSLRP